MLPSEAAGVPTFNGQIYTEFLIDCDTYFLSLQELAKLDADRILFAHNYIFDGEDAKKHFPRAIKQGFEFKERITELLNQYGADTEKIVQIIKKEEYDITADPKQPETAYLINLRAKIKAVDKSME